MNRLDMLMFNDECHCLNCSGTLCKNPKCSTVTLNHDGFCSTKCWNDKMEQRYSAKKRLKLSKKGLLK